VRSEIAVIRRVLEAARDDPQSLRALALAWIESERERGMSAQTLSLRWRTLSALLGAIKRRAAESGERIAVDLGPRPRAPQRPLVDGDVAALVRELAADGRHRDAVIVGLLGELGLRDHEVLALRVRDVATLPASPPLAAALARVTRDARPQRAVLCGRPPRELSSASLYGIVEHLGTTVAALRRAAKRQQR
jgi:integrase